MSLNVRKPSPIGFNQLNEEITNKNVDIGSNVVTQRNDDFNATSPIVNNLYSTSTPSNIPMKRNNTSVYQHTKPYNNETVNTNNINNSNKFNLNRPNVTISTDWNWWPFNVLTYLFNASPSQRFTMMIAYAM